VRLHIGWRIAAIIVGCLGAPAWGMDLFSAYRDALANDANFLAARSALEAARQYVPQARAGLLPQVSASAQRTENQTDRTLIQVENGQSGPTITSSYPAESAVLSLRQPLFRRYNWAQLSFAEAQVAAAEAAFEKDRQDAGLRVATAYFDVLLAQARVSTLRAELDALTGQQTLAERAFAAGYGTRTDIDETRARVQQSRAALLDANYNLDNARRSLAALVGRNASAVADVVPERLRLAPAEPAMLEHWLKQTEAGNPELASLRRQVEMAQQDVEKQRAGHFPTLDLIAARQYGQSESSTSINQRYTTDYIGLQLAVPIYSGGGVSAAVRQAEANSEKARFQLEAARQRLGVETQKYFNGVAQGVDKVRANEAALASSRDALLSIRKGVEAGTRTVVDVLNQVQRVAEATQSLAQARYEFLLNRLRLAAVAGQLDDDLVKQVNTALGHP
jgi:TolC family type I secretion outer membrane protein